MERHLRQSYLRFATFAILAVPFARLTPGSRLGLRYSDVNEGTLALGTQCPGSSGNFAVAFPSCAAAASGWGNNILQMDIAPGSALVGKQVVYVLVTSVVGFSPPRLLSRLQWRVNLPCGNKLTAVGFGKSGRVASLTNALPSAVTVENPSCSGIRSFTGGVPMALVKIDIGGSGCVPLLARKPGSGRSPRDEIG